MKVDVTFYFIILVATFIWIVREIRFLKIRKQFEQKSRMLIEGLSEAYFEIDLNGNLVLFSGTISNHVFGFDKSQIVGKNLRTLLTDDSKMIFNEVVSEIKNSCMPQNNIRLSYLNKNGTAGYICCSLFPVKGFGGITKKIAGVFQDITRQVKLEQSMKESEQRYRSLFDYNPKAVFSFDLMGNFTTMNPICEQYTGYSAIEFANLSFEDITLAEDLVKTKLHFDKAVHGEPQNFETRIVRKNKEILDVDVTNVPIMVDGVVIGVYGISEDITEYKRTQEFLRRSEKLAVVGELSAGIAHEIRNPLTSIKGFVQLLQESEIRYSQKYLKIILDEILRVETIINRYLSFAREEVPVFKEVNIFELLNQVVQLMTPQALMNNVMISFDNMISTPLVAGDRAKLEQVFVNIIKNAIESMPDGGDILLNIDFFLDSNQVMIQVIDHGNGIPKNRISKLGEPFYTTKEKGTGLGLMTCYKIIGNHRGQICIESTEGYGTTVNIMLPTLTGI